MARSPRSRKRRPNSQSSREQDDFVPPALRQASFGLPKGALRRGEELLWEQEAPQWSYVENARTRALAPDPDWVEHAWSAYLGSQTRRSTLH